MTTYFEKVYFRRTTDQIFSDDFDKYGFAHTLIEKKDGMLNVEFYTKDPSKNIVTRNKCLTLPSGDDPVVPSNFVRFSTLAAFVSESELQKLDIVETIKYLLTNTPAYCAEILQNMPSCLYENKEVALDIFRCIPNMCRALSKAEKAIGYKFKVMQEYKDILDAQQKSPEQLHQKIEETYATGMKKLHSDGGKN